MSHSCRVDKEIFANGKSGSGLFACIDIQPRALFTEYGGDLVSASAAAAEEIKSHHCSVCDGTGRVLVGYRAVEEAVRRSNSSFGSFVNCCNPNIPGDINRVNCFLLVIVFTSTMHVRVFLVANQFIPAGTALVLSYGANATASHHIIE